jgi:tripartite-type tricarboxylate transporter receptor subunit TctC
MTPKPLTGRPLWALALTILLLAACAPAGAGSPGAPVGKPAASAPQAGPPARPAAQEQPTGATGAPRSEARTDDPAIAAFYRGKTVRIISGSGPGGLFDVYSRQVGRNRPRHLPGNPNIIVENRPGAGHRLAANAVYAVEPKDGTVIGHISQNLVLEQVIDTTGMEFDTARFQWLGSALKSTPGCMVRVDAGVTRVQDAMNGRELITAADAPGSSLYDVPAVLNAALGTRFKLVSGYNGISQAILALESKEVDAFCVSDPLSGPVGILLSRENPSAKLIVLMGAESPAHPLAQGVPVAEPLARSEEARQLLRAMNAPQQMSFPWVVAPDVPPERVAALRQALAETFADPQFLAEAERSNLVIGFSSGEEVTRMVQAILSTPPGALATLKELRK